MKAEDIIVGKEYRIRQWDDKEEEYGLTSVGSINAPLIFSTSMRNLCGELVFAESRDRDLICSCNYFAISSGMLEELTDTVYSNKEALHMILDGTPMRPTMYGYDARVTFVECEGFVLTYDYGTTEKALGVLGEEEWTVYDGKDAEPLEEGDLVYVSDTDDTDTSTVKVFIKVDICKFMCGNLNGRANYVWKYATKVPKEDLLYTNLRLPKAALKQFNEETLYSNYATK